MHGHKNIGGKDGFVFKLDSKGNRVWTELIGSSSDEIITGIFVDEKNGIITHGTTDGNLFDSTNQGLTDVFLFRLNK